MPCHLIYDLLSHSAQLHPTHIAVESGEQRLSYRELDRQSTDLAMTLEAHGIGVGDRVALHLDKSPQAVVAIFGVLKAGAVYVPLDRRAPATRSAVITADCGITAVIGTLRGSLAILSQSESRERGPKLLIAVDEVNCEVPADLIVLDWSTALKNPASQVPGLQSSQTGEALAYILYTSGSTGTPKGVMISHMASSSFIDWACDSFAIKPDDRVIGHAPLHFDLSVFDLFVTCKAAATLVLPPAGITVTPAAYARFLEQAAISVFYATPAMLTTLVNHGAIDKLLWQPLRLILFAGDVMPPRPLRKWMETIPTARYFNLYGPTETNVCTWFEVRRPPHEDQARIPIGCACPHVETRIVNADHATVARGQAGELWVRGPSLMSGYWGRTEHSAAAFAADPLQPACAGGLFYRTGDRVMADSEGNLIFLGRLDNMIKTRGYRVEPEEVEAVLTRHPKVTEAAVIAVRDENEITLLKAIVAPAGEKPEIRELKRWCAKRLPDYMIPWHIEFTASLPKTSSGKLDRALLNTRLQESPRSNTP